MVLVLASIRNFVAALIINQLTVSKSHRPRKICQLKIVQRFRVIALLFAQSLFSKMNACNGSGIVSLVPTTTANINSLQN